MIETLNEEQVTLLKGMVQEAVDSMYRADAEKGLRKDIADRAKDKLDLPSKQFNALVKIAYKANAEQLNQETTELLDLAEAVGIYAHRDDDE